MKTEIFVKLTIISSRYIPEQIDAIVGVRSDSSWRIDDLRGNTIIKEKDNGWMINSGLEKYDNLDNHINALLKKILPFSKEIKSLSVEDYVEISCAIYADDTPALHFEKDVIKTINELGASLDIDLYLT